MSCVIWGLVLLYMVLDSYCALCQYIMLHGISIKHNI